MTVNLFDGKKISGAINLISKSLTVSLRLLITLKLRKIFSISWSNDLMDDIFQIGDLLKKFVEVLRKRIMHGLIVITWTEIRKDVPLLELLKYHSRGKSWRNIVDPPLAGFLDQCQDLQKGVELCRPTSW